MSRRRTLGRSKNTFVVLAHTEYITDITPSQAFTMQIDEPIQPGLPFLFPWLNTIARNFETYKVLKLIFHYRSTSADAVLSTVAPSGSTSLGSVIMMAQYNVLADPPETKREMLNNATATSCKPSNSMMFTVNPRSSYKTLFVRTPYTPGGGDRRLYDLADFHLATEGMQATTGSIGELSVTAVMRFTKPTLVNEIDPIDIFNFYNTYTPDINGNALGWLQIFPLPVNTMVVEALPESTMNGVIKMDPQDQLFKYYFPESTDNQIGAVFQVIMKAQAICLTPGAQIFLHDYYSEDNSVAGRMKFNNCQRVNIGGLGGFIPNNQPTILPANIVTSGYQPSPVVINDTRNLITMFFIEITGPKANFGFDTTTYPNTQILWRAFQANGTPYAPTGGMQLKKQVWISRVQYAATG